MIKLKSLVESPKQAQYSLIQQLSELIQLANKNGLYDAADWIQNTWNNNKLKSGK